MPGAVGRRRRAVRLAATLAALALLFAVGSVALGTALGRDDARLVAGA